MGTGTTEGGDRCRRGLVLLSSNFRFFDSDEFFDEKKQLREVDSVRVAVNDWIRSGGDFDGFVDIDAIARDPADPTKLKPDYHQAVADAIDLSLFTRQ